mmetsp:Transcript_13617/g.29230  ORF Transcript_13617/g.29230 Transcript_13617/m.29230 type:complete len:236 (-) Transcript_13617:618-1325(-)
MGNSSSLLLTNPVSAPKDEVLMVIFHFNALALLKKGNAKSFWDNASFLEESSSSLTRCRPRLSSYLDNRRDRSCSAFSFSSSPPPPPGFLVPLDCCFSPNSSFSISRIFFLISTICPLTKRISECSTLCAITSSLRVTMVLVERHLSKSATSFGWEGSYRWRYVSNSANAVCSSPHVSSSQYVCTNKGKDNASSSGLDEGGRRRGSLCTDDAEGMAAVAPRGRVKVWGAGGRGLE